jgi:Pyruvate/2-oxoacid:ferredoxin oxidoreductase delta subunit
MDEAAGAAGIGLREFQPGREVHFPEGVQNKRFTIAEVVLDSDGVISLPKLKSHGMQKFTGCVKNQFGCIPGLLKGEFHVRVPDAYGFARMLVDLDRLVHPRLYVMDGIVAMEGNGPRGGTPRRMNLLLFSEDPIAVDATVCRLIDLDPLLVPTTAFGQEAGRGTAERDRIELVGDDFDSFRCRDFVIDRQPIKPYREKGALRFVSNRLVPKPVIDETRCVRCGLCVKVCPAKPKAVDWRGGDTKQPPAHDYRSCIRCYCCQELCPENAIALKKPLLRRLLNF